MQRKKERQKKEKGRNAKGREGRGRKGKTAFITDPKVSNTGINMLQQFTTENLKNFNTKL